MKKLILMAISANMAMAADSINSTTVPSSQADFSGMVANPRLGNSGLGNVQLNLVVRCFGTNLRSTSQVMRPEGQIRAVITANTVTTELRFEPDIVYQEINERFEDFLANPTNANARSLASGGAGSVSGFGTITADLQDIRTISTELNSDGTIVSSAEPIDFNIEFFQNVGGNDQPLRAQRSKKEISPDGSMVEYEASFAGAYGFCGGYVSPLMVYFDEKRPQFKNVSDFPIFPGVKTHWPEKNAPGYFIADMKGKSKIDSKDQLFGDSKEHKNGFEALAAYDENKDKKISGKELGGLVLWQDKNGDGVSTSSEITSFKEKGIESISLNYHNDNAKFYGKRAKVVESSTFSYVIDGKRKQGVVEDVWFKPVMKRVSKLK